MPLPASGSISISQVSVELGRASTATTSLGESAVRTLAGVPTGAISMSNLWGKSAYNGPPTVEYLVVAGAGGGAGGTWVAFYVAPYYYLQINPGGGGGAGGYVTASGFAITQEQHTQLQSAQVVPVALLALMAIKAQIPFFLLLP